MSKERKQTLYRVVYLVWAKPKVINRGLSRPAAEAQMRYLKRRGHTAWVETDGGDFVPVKGAMRNRFPSTAHLK